MMNSVGRRTLLLWGTGVSVAIFMAIGGLGVRARIAPSSAISWATGALLLVDSFVANLTIQPISFALLTEIPSTLLRSKSIVLARIVNLTVNITCTVLTPYQLNSAAWNWGAMAGFFWAGSCTIAFLFTFYCVPEPKGRTIAELDIIFQRKTPTRKFPTTEVHISEITEKMN